jgi:hypothetical protein
MGRWLTATLAAGTGPATFDLKRELKQGPQKRSDLLPGLKIERSQICIRFDRSGSRKRGAGGVVIDD